MTDERRAEPRPDRTDATPVTWGQFRRYTRRATAAFLVLFLVSAAALYWAQQAREDADVDIFKSRIGSVHANCLKYNEIQATLSDLIRVSLTSPPPKDLTGDEQRQVDGIVARFRFDLARLAANDCATQRALLYAALAGHHFDRSVPYLHSFRHWRPTRSEEGQ